MFFFLLEHQDHDDAEDEFDSGCSRCGAELTDAEEGFSECDDCRD